jgi:hypothetical protein
LSLFRRWMFRLLPQQGLEGRFARVGRGIERRARRLAVHWEPHLAMSKRAGRRWMDQAADLRGTLAVLGAGRLLDFDAEGAAAHFGGLLLVDADPSAAALWALLRQQYSPSCRVTGSIRELSGVLAGWESRLRDGLARIPRSGVRASRWQDALEAVRRAPVFSFPDPWEGLPTPPVAVLSLGLLSQIPIMWQDIVEDLLAARFPRYWVRARDKEWIAAIEPAARALVEAHLGALDRSGCQSLLLITDLDYLYYRGVEPYAVRRLREPPVVWHEGQEAPVWREPGPGPGASLVVEPALYGVQLLDAATLDRLLPHYRLLWRESWLWHISPLGTESSYGTVHRVAALALERSAASRSWTSGTS